MKYNFFYFQNVTEESFTTFLLSEVDLYYCERLYVLALKIIQDEIWFSLSTSFRKVKKLSDSFSSSTSILTERNKHSLESCIKACNFSRVLMNQFGVFDGTSIFLFKEILNHPFDEDSPMVPCREGVLKPVFHSASSLFVYF